MSYKYKNIINLQGPEEEIRTALRQIRHPDYDAGSIDFKGLKDAVEKK